MSAIVHECTRGANIARDTQHSAATAEGRGRALQDTPLPSTLMPLRRATRPGRTAGWGARRATAAAPHPPKPTDSGAEKASAVAAAASTHTKTLRILASPDAVLEFSCSWGREQRSWTKPGKEGTMPRVASEDWVREGQAAEEKKVEENPDAPPAWVTGASAGSRASRSSIIEIRDQHLVLSNILSSREIAVRLGSARLGPDATMRSRSRSNAAQAPDGTAAQAPRPAGNGSGLATATRLSNLGASVKRQQQFDRSARACQERSHQRHVAAHVTLGLERDQASSLGLALARAKAQAAHVSEELAAQRLWLFKEQARLVDFTAPDKQAMLSHDRLGVSYDTLLPHAPLYVQRPRDARRGAVPQIHQPGARGAVVLTEQSTRPTTQHGRDAGEDDGVAAGKSEFAEEASSDLVATSSNLRGAPLVESGGNRPLSPVCGIPGTKDEGRLALAHEHAELVEDWADAETTAGGRALLNYFASEATGEYAVSVETEEDKRLSRLGLLDQKRQERRRAVREIIATYNSIRKAPGYVPIEALLNPNEGLLSTESRFCRSLTRTHLTTFGGSKIWTRRAVESYSEV